MQKPVLSCLDLLEKGQIEGKKRADRNIKKVAYLLQKGRKGRKGKYKVKTFKKGAKRGNLRIFRILQKKSALLPQAPKPEEDQAPETQGNQNNTTRLYVIRREKTEMKELLSDIRGIEAAISYHDDFFESELKLIVKQHEDGFMNYQYSDKIKGTRGNVMDALDRIEYVANQLRTVADNIDKLIAWRRDRIQGLFNLMDTPYCPEKETQEKEK